MGYGFVNIIERGHIDELINLIFREMFTADIRAVFRDAAGNIIRNANVNGAINRTRHDIDVILHARTLSEQIK